MLTGVAEGVEDRAREHGIDPRERLTSYVNKGKDAYHDVGRILQSKFRTRHEGVPELVTKADVAFLIGGGKNTMFLGVLMIVSI